MLKNFFTKYSYELSFNLLILFIFIFFYGYFGDINVDSFREAYIPTQMLAKKTLYKDIFMIYAPFSYFFNSLLYLIFGQNLTVLYISGLTFTLGITNISYKLASRFIEKKYSLSILLFFITTAILSPNVFNTIFPYSYGMLYGLFFILCSVYLILCKKETLSYLFYSLAICSKYEFIFILPLLIYLSTKKNILKNILALIFPPLLCLILLFIQGVSINDIVTSFSIVTTMTTTKTLKWFYSIMGYNLSISHIPIYLSNFLQILLPIGIITYIRKNWIIPFAFIYLCFLLNNASFIYLYPLITILLIFRYKYLSKQELIMILASILISLKVFFAMTIQSYGIYFFIFALISLYILTPKKIRKGIFIILILSSVIFSYKNSQQLLQKNVKIKSDNGIVRTTSFYGKSYLTMLSYITNNTTAQDMIVVYPEGLAINFLSQRFSDNKFYSLIPLYVETFSENIIIERLKIIKPKFIIITDYDTSDYYFKSFGLDYAENIKKYIEEDYTIVNEYNTGMSYKIYQIKEINN